MDGEKTYNFDQLNELILMCCDYAEREEDETTRLAYHETLRRIFIDKLTKSDIEVWYTLIHSGVFHDAVGKEKEYSGEYVTVYTIY